MLWFLIVVVCYPKFCEIMKHVLEFAKERNVYGLGRWGEHEHYNSDVAVNWAFALFKKIYEK